MKSRSTQFLQGIFDWYNEWVNSPDPSEVADPDIDGIEKHLKDSEVKAYYITEEQSTRVTQFMIDSWYDDEVLSDDAENFIAFCKEKNQVASLKGFSVMQNINQETAGIMVFFY